MTPTCSAFGGPKEIAASLGITIPVLALAWALRTPVVTTAIIGASHPQHIDDALAASRLTLDPEVVARIQSFGAPIGTRY